VAKPLFQTTLPSASGITGSQDRPKRSVD
jgi:hypothetical protein